MPLPLARIEGKYEIVAKIREGGMGALYRVRHRLLDEIRVIKVLRSQLDDPEVLRARFSEEARAAIKLRHPNVVQIFDFTLDDDGVGLIVMEHIDGVDLGQLIAARRVPSLALALEISRQALRALGYLHRRGFVHRDVSPDNLMLTRDVDGRPLVKIIDLGIAKHGERAHELTSKGMFLGKFRYASPEHFGEGGDEIEARSDLYAFGIVLYELLTGARPIAGDDPSALIAGHLFRPPRPFAESDPEGRVPEALRQAVLAALEKRPESRVADAATFAAAIEGVQQDFPLDDGTHHELAQLIQPATDAAPSPPPGSTQHRLDLGFDLARTPEPSAAAMPWAVPAPEDDVEASDDPLDALLATGCRLAADGRHGEAIVVLRRALDTQPENTTVQRLLEESLHQRDAAQRRWDEAVAQRFTALDTALEADDLPGAARAIETLRTTLGPEAPLPADHVAVVAGHERLDAAIEALSAAQDRHEAIRAAAEAIETMIAEDRLMEADAALFQAHETHGASGKLSALRQRLDDVHHRKLEVRVRALVARAEQAAGQRDFPTALDCLQRAAVAAGRGPLGDDVAQLTERMQRDANAHHRHQAIVETERTILRAIQDRQLDTALQVLEAAETRFGMVEPFDALRQILERTQHEDRNAARINRLLRDAKEHRAAERFDDAVECFRGAAALDPSDAWIKDRLDEAIADRDRRAAAAANEAARAAEATRAIDATAEAIEALRDAGDKLGAWRAVREALAEHGNADRLVRLRDSLADEILDQ